MKSELTQDCISRRDAIDALGDEPEVWTGKDEYALGLNNQWHYDRNAILRCPSAQPELIEQGAYVRGFEQGRTQGRIDAQGEPMSRLINNTIKAEWTNADALNLQSTCNQLATNTISRQVAIDALADYIHNVDKVIGTGHLSADDCKDAATSVLAGLPSAQPQWIPVTERLPEEETDVLVTRKFLGCKDGSHGWNNHIPPTTYVEVAQYFDGEWTAFSDEYKVSRSRHTDPIAWMPLPTPWEGGQDG